MSQLERHPTLRVPTHGDLVSHRLEITSGKMLPDQTAPRLKRRCELTREEALKLWDEKKREGWLPAQPQWTMPTDRRHGPPECRR